MEGAGKADLKPASSRQNAMKAGAQAQDGYNEKFRKYKRLLADQDYNHKRKVSWILPLAFQSTGYLHKDGLDFLEKLAARAHNVKMIPKANLLIYFKRRLACCLAKNLALTINKRGHTVASRSGGVADRSFDSRHIMELAPDN